MVNGPSNSDNTSVRADIESVGPDATADQEVFSERLENVARQGRFGLLLHPALAVILSQVVWLERSDFQISLWVGAIFLVSLLRLVHFMLYMRTGGKANDRQAALVFVIGAGISGCLWGYAALYLMPEPGSIHRELLFIILIGLTAGSALLASAYVPVSIAFNTTVLVPLAYAYWVESQIHHELMAALIICFVLLMIQMARVSEDTIKNAIYRRRENDRLVISLRTAVAEAESARKSQSEFLANISHEIRTPMNGVLGMISMAMGEDAAKRRRYYLETAERSANYLLRIINDLLDLSHIEAGKFSFRKETFELEPLIREAVELIRPQARKKGLDVSLECSNCTGFWLISDPERLRQVLLNLLGNAVKFTEQGKVTLSAALEDGATGHLLRVVVKDTGRGISEDLRSRLFGRFQRGDGSYTSEQQGTGLGLAICREIVQGLGGRIGVDSKEGEGSQFWFEVPVEIDRAQDERVEAGGQSQCTYSLHMLVVEDNEINQQVVQAVLEHFGHSYKTVGSGQAALDALDAAAEQNEGFDAVLMDVQMPGMDGTEATQAIRQRSDAFADIPVIALTAHAMPHHRDEYLAAGMDGYVSKPIEPSAMEAEIRRVLEARPDYHDSLPDPPAGADRKLSAG